MWTAEYRTLPFQASKVLSMINRTEERTPSAGMCRRLRDGGIVAYLQRPTHREWPAKKELLWSMPIRDWQVIAVSGGPSKSTELSCP